MDDESCESMEPMEEVPLMQLGEAELERLVEGYGLHSGHVAMSSGVAWSRLRTQGVKFAMVVLSRCSLSTACLNEGHSLRRRATPVGFHTVWPVSIKNFRRSTQRKPLVSDTCHAPP